MTLTQNQIQAINSAIYHLQEAESDLLGAGFSIEAEVKLHNSDGYAGTIVSYDEGEFRLDVFDAHEKP